MERTVTNRGFALIEFGDLYGTACTVQESSLASEPALWIGTDGSASVLTPGEGWTKLTQAEVCNTVARDRGRPEEPGQVVLHNRMHVGRAQARELIELLQAFVENGDLSAWAPTETVDVATVATMHEDAPDWRTAADGAPDVLLPADLYASERPTWRVRWEWSDGYEDDGESTVEAFLAVNAEDEYVCETVLALGPGQSTTFGGGAAPECVVTRILPPEVDFDLRHLAGDARRAADAVRRWVQGWARGAWDRDKDAEPYGGGCRAFYSPQEWAERGEEYGTDAVVVVVHDGGDLSAASGALASNAALGSLERELKLAGFRFERLTGWYSAVYPLGA